MKVLIPTNDKTKCEDLVKSLRKYNWDYEILYSSDWPNNLKKIELIRKYLLEHDIQNFMCCDAFDVICVGKKELPENLIGVGTNCWPDEELAKDYPKTDSIFKYVNAGLYTMNKELFLKLSEDYEWAAPSDQRWLTKHALKLNLNLDHNANYFFNIFGTEKNKDYVITDKVITKYDTTPCFIHGNGKSDLTEFKRI